MSFFLVVDKSQTDWSLTFSEWRFRFSLFSWKNKNILLCVRYDLTPNLHITVISVVSDKESGFGLRLRFSVIEKPVRHYKSQLHWHIEVASVSACL